MKKNRVFLTLTATGLISCPAAAIDFSDGQGLEGKFNGTLTWGTQIRSESANPLVYSDWPSRAVPGTTRGLLQGQTGGSNLNFAKGEPISTVLKAVVTGWLAVRRQGIYFAMVTLALSQMIYFICVQAPFTYAEDGIQSIPRGKLFGVIDLANDTAMYYVVAAVFVFGFALIYRIIHSPFGQVLKSVRENEPRALSLGYNVDRYKLLAFVLSGTIAGLAGATKSIAFGIATLTDVSWQMSGEVVLMTLLGGMGTILGPALGAAIIVTMQNYLADLGSMVSIIMGLTFVVCVLAFRRGIVGEIEHRLGRKS